MCTSTPPPSTPADGYYLDGYRTSTCNAGRGQWAISDTVLETDGSSGALIVRVCLVRAALEDWGPRLLSHHLSPR